MASHGRGNPMEVTVRVGVCTAMRTRMAEGRDSVEAQESGTHHIQ